MKPGPRSRGSVSRPPRPLILGVVAGLLKAGLGILFLYLGTIKLLGRDEAARLAAMGVDRYVRDTVGGLELTVAALLLARTSGYLLHSLVVAVSLVEVGVLHRAPLAAVACLAAHGLSTWARSSQERRRTVDAIRLVVQAPYTRATRAPTSAPSAPAQQ